MNHLCIIFFIASICPLGVSVSQKRNEHLSKFAVIFHHLASYKTSTFTDTFKAYTVFVFIITKAISLFRYYKIIVTKVVICVTEP